MGGTITIGGHSIQIIRTDSIIDEGGGALHGVWRPREGCIYISRQSGSLQGQTLIHELMHAIDDIYNNGKLDEDTIDALAQGLYQVLKGGDVYKALSLEHPEGPGGDA